MSWGGVNIFFFFFFCNTEWALIWLIILENVIVGLYGSQMRWLATMIMNLTITVVCLPQNFSYVLIQSQFSVSMCCLIIIIIIIIVM